MIRIAALASLVAIVLNQSPAQSGKPKTPAVREILLKSKPKFAPGDVKKPLVVSSAADLAMHFEGEVEAELRKAVHFEHEKLVVFRWAGSGGDRLTPALENDGKLAVFRYKAGFTDDLRRHQHFFAIPREAAVKVE